MKKDWSIIRITVLLYFIVILLPLNYYFVKQSFDAMKYDASTMTNLVFINGSLLQLTTTHSLNERDTLIEKIENSLKTIDQHFISYEPNKKFVTLFRADETYKYLQHSAKDLKKQIYENNSLKAFTKRMIRDVNAFAETTQGIITYKIEIVLDRLYLSLTFSMISMIILIFLIRIYMKVQLMKHSIYDLQTGLYNNKYFKNVLTQAQTLAIRQEKPLSLLVLCITNYDDVQTQLSKKAFEANLKEFSEIFSHFFRRSDTVCRIEKGCFASIAPDSTSENINKLSNRLQEKLQSAYLNKPIRMNISIGIATYTKESDSTQLDEAKKDMHNSNIVIGGNS